MKSNGPFHWVRVNTPIKPGGTLAGGLSLSGRCVVFAHVPLTRTYARPDAAASFRSLEFVKSSEGRCCYGPRFMPAGVSPLEVDEVGSDCLRSDSSSGSYGRQKCRLLSLRNSRLPSGQGARLQSGCTYRCTLRVLRAGTALLGVLLIFGNGQIACAESAPQIAPRPIAAAAADPDTVHVPRDLRSAQEITLEQFRKRSWLERPLELGTRFLNRLL